MRFVVALFSCIAAASAFGQTFTVAVRESVTIPIFGATAAWAVDGSLVDVHAGNGDVTLSGRSGGRTKIIVVTLTGEHAFDVIVSAPVAKMHPADTRTDHGTAEARYSSAAREIQNSVTVTRAGRERRTEATLRTVHYAAQQPGDRARTSVPSASYRIFTRGRELTLLDREIDASPLTLSGTVVRGIHYLDEHWRVHAGYTAYAAYRSFLVPVERERVAGAAYAFRTSRGTLTPTLFNYANAGNVVSMLYDYARGDAFAARAEIGYSRGFGAAAQLAYDGARDRARLDVRYRPSAFAIIGPGETRGLLAEGSWNRTYGRGSNAAANFTMTDISAFGGRVVSASADVDHRVNRVLSLTGGGSWGSFRSIESLTVPAGARFDFARGSAGALYRYARSGTNRGGHGGRVFARASVGRLSASAYADLQQNAPTLDVIFAEQPELALALEELGIVATSPADIARALQEHAELVELGYIDGVTVELAPVRTQFGLELAWTGGTAANHQLRARFLRNSVETVATRTVTTIATLSYARRVTDSTDVLAGYSYWRTERRGQKPVVEPYFELGMRHHFDGLPELGGGNGTISGIVFADEDLDGTSDGRGVAAVIELDGNVARQTNDDGSFTFTKVGRGSHRVVARVPDHPEAYFTTPSRVEAEAGEKIGFGVATTPARAFGRVIDDAATGIAGVRVALARGPRRIEAVTESDGGFSFAAPPGEWQMSIVGDTVPAGYALNGAAPRTVTLDRTQPIDTTWTLRALRSISGRGAPPHRDIRVEPLAKSVRSDAAGNFSVRSLPAGEVTLVIDDVRHRIELPKGPGAVELDVTPQRAEAHNDGTFFVQIGAFRVRANAADAAMRARRAGVSTVLVERGSLTLVRSEPFALRGEAEAAAKRLWDVGLEAVVLSKS